MCLHWTKEEQLSPSFSRRGSFLSSFPLFAFINLFHWISHSRSYSSSPASSSSSDDNQYLPRILMAANSQFDNTTATSILGDEWKLGIVKICLFSTFFVLGLIGNSLVLIGIGLNKGMQTPTNLLIFNLALADILFIIVCIPTTLFSFFGRWPFTNVGCKLGKWTESMSSWRGFNEYSF